MIVFGGLFVLIVNGQFAINKFTYVAKNSSLFCEIITQVHTLFQSCKTNLPTWEDSSSP